MVVLIRTHSVKPRGTYSLGDRVLTKLHSWGQGKGGSSLKLLTRAPAFSCLSWEGSSEAGRHPKVNNEHSLL